MTAKTGLRIAAGNPSIWLLSCTALTVVVSSQAAAQQAATPPAASDAALEEIIVTAQKRSENLQNVPIAVAAFSADTLAAKGVAGLSDLALVTPSLRFSFNAASGSPFLRGVGSDQTFAGAEAEVQTYIDGVYYGSGGSAFTRFNNIARVEVDKGPQGTLFGRNATGGVIQIFTRDPSHDPKLDASVGYGNFNMKEADLYASTGLSDKLAGDIAVHFDDRDGWGRNVTLNRDAFTAHSIGVRSKWLFEPSDDTRLTFIADYGRDRSDLGTAFVVAAAPWHQSLAVPAPTFVDYFTTNGDTYARGNVSRYGASLKLETKLGSLPFVSISAYRDTSSKGYVDADKTPAPSVIGIDTRSEKQASQEFQLLSPAGSRLQWILGTFLYYNKSQEDPTRLEGTLFGGFVPGTTALLNYSAMTTKSVAGFGQATYDLTDSTHVTAGLRYTHDHRHQDATTIFVFPFGQVVPPAPLNVNDFPNASFNALTGKLTIAQDLSDHTMVYAGYSRGFKSGTFNNLVFPLSNVGPALDPEHIDAFEGGVKSDLLDGRLRLNLAAFYYRYTNLQVNVFTAFGIGLQNAATSNIKGLEADGQFAIAKNTRLTGGLSVLDAKYKSFPSAPLYTINPVDSFNPANLGFGGAIVGSASADGHNMPYAPKFSGNFGINQKIEMSAGDLDLNATVSYQSRTYFTPDNLYSQSAYATVSGSAKWTATSGKWDLTLWARNLTDKHTFAQLTIASFGAGGIPSEPRAYGARVGVHF